MINKNQTRTILVSFFFMVSDLTPDKTVSIEHKSTQPGQYSGLMQCFCALEQRMLLKIFGFRVQRCPV